MYVSELGLECDGDEAIAAMAEKIYNFESEIARGMWDKTEARDPANVMRKKKIGAVETNKVVADWAAFLNEIFVKVEAGNEPVNSDTFVNAADEKWFGNVNKALENAKMNDDDLKDYIAWRVHMSVVSYLGADWRKISEEFDQTVSGTTPKARADLFRRKSTWSKIEMVENSLSRKGKNEFS